MTRRRFAQPAQRPLVSVTVHSVLRGGTSIRAWAAGLLVLVGAAGCGGERASPSGNRSGQLDATTPESRPSDMHTWARTARHWALLAPGALPKVVRLRPQDRGFVTGTSEHEVVRGTVAVRLPRGWQRVRHRATTYRARFGGECVAGIRLEAHAVATSHGSRYVTGPAFTLYDKLGAGRLPTGTWTAAWGDGTRYHGDSSSYATRGIDARSGLRIAPRRFWMVTAFVAPRHCSDDQLTDGPLPASVIAVVRHVTSRAHITTA